MADAEPQPQDAREPGPENDDPPRVEEEPQPPLRGLPSPPLGSRARRAARHRQPPLLASLPAPLAEIRQAGADDPEVVRLAIAELGRAGAVELYGWRLVGPLLNDLDQSGRTGTETR